VNNSIQVRELENFQDLVSGNKKLDLSWMMKVAESLESGMAVINKGVISDPIALFGGFKQSGLGREGGFHGLNELLEAKFIGLEI
jgi:succinate-semialdehyde dehydrogenase/glutarate-semialdehyde dehydrogenase